MTEPLALRARRVRALFACRLQEGVFPAVPGAEPFFGDAERERIAAASGLRLRRRDDLGAERYLFYATVSRPEERLYLSWHEASDDGDQAVPSFFLSDVCDLFGPALSERRRMRTLGEVGWPGDAPTERERLRAAAAAGPRHREPSIAALGDTELVGELRERPTWSASGVELWAGCPVRWFVERRLTPEGLTPDPELMLRGELAHRVLEATLSGLREQTGSARLDADSLPIARTLATAALERLERDPRLEMSPDPSRRRALARRLRSDVERYLAHAAKDGSELEPSSLEVAFGAGEDGLPALELAGGVRIGGRIDRIDRGPSGEAIVYDYKGRNAPDAASWRRERKYQVAMYVLAARDVLGLDPVGGLYQPLGARDQRPRGLVLAGADPGLDTVATDRREREDFDATVAGVVEDVLEAVGELRAGRLEPRPQTLRLERRGLHVPDDLPVLGVMSGLIGPGGRPFTAEQAVAIRAREGSLLLEANAGSGKTSVLVERFVRSVLEDGVRPPRILAITFTERAAGELRARVRARFVELGHREEARETETAWVSTIHGFCARVLRAHAIAAGLDPAFSVLDEAAARALRDQAWDRALAAWLDGGHGAAALDIVAAYDTDRLRTMVARVHDALRSDGLTCPVLPSVRVAGEPGPLREALAAAAARAARELALAGAGKRVGEAREKVARCVELLAAATPATTGFPTAAGAAAAAGFAAADGLAADGVAAADGLPPLALLPPMASPPMALLPPMALPPPMASPRRAPALAPPRPRRRRRRSPSCASARPPTR